MPTSRCSRKTGTPTGFPSLRSSAPSASGSLSPARAARQPAPCGAPRRDMSTRSTSPSRAPKTPRRTVLRSCAVRPYRRSTRSSRMRHCRRVTHLFRASPLASPCTLRADLPRAHPHQRRWQRCHQDFRHGGRRGVRARMAPRQHRRARQGAPRAHAALPRPHARLQGRHRDGNRPRQHGDHRHGRSARPR